LKFKRKNNFLSLLQSAGILLSVVASLFAHVTLAAAPVISHHVMIPANTLANQSLLVSNSQVHPTASSDSSTQSSSVQGAESNSILPQDQITLQQSAAPQKNISDSQLVINAPAALLERPAEIIGFAALSVSYASPVVAISVANSYVFAQSLSVVKKMYTNIIEPFAFSNSEQQPAQAIIPVSGQHKNSLGSPSQFNSNNIAIAASYVNSQKNISQSVSVSVEILRC
jgi:hypothetical protein